MAAISVGQAPVVECPFGTGQCVVNGRVYHKSGLSLILLAIVSSGVMAAPDEGRFMASDGDRQAAYQRSQGQEKRAFHRRESDWGRGSEIQRSPRLSQEERRQLRQDIRNAGREIYPRRRQLER